MNTTERARETVDFTVPCEDRLDKLVSAALEITRSCAAKLIEDGAVSAGGKLLLKKSEKPKVDSLITVVLPPAELCEAKPQDIPVDIVYEDDDVAVVNKPQGMVVHPAPGNPDGTLVNALMYHMKGRLSTINGVIRPGIVHRIDKDTGGLLLIAKNDEAHLSLAAQIAEHACERVYEGVVNGRFKEPSGTVDAAVGRHPSFRKKMAVVPDGKSAVTHYETLEAYPAYAYMRFKLETGRTHQIRVHAAYKGHPLVGDPLYAPRGGENPFGLTGQCLYAKTIAFTHPVTGERLRFEGQLPDWFTGTLAKLRHQ